MLNAQETQFTLGEDGQIFYQPLAGNPLPGEPIARLEKGETILKPKIALGEADALKDLEASAVREKLEGWLAGHLSAVLEPLVALEKADDLKGAVSGIVYQVYEALGIVPREKLEDLIADLDADDRRVLRQKNIRLGPILVFMPALNKPAAVRLRALLWGLYNDKSLPMNCPNDGIVSFEVDPGAIDPAFYQAIAYPVYAKRAIRIDMLDRVICAVYDGASEGKFQAQHQMAEWLGSTIESLYEVLEAMGHKKIFDPAEQAETEVQEPAGEEKADENSAGKTETQEKPELATFRLKKGKAFKHSSGERAGKKPEKKKGKRNKSTNRTPKVMSTGPEKRLEDSPFAILEQLKK